MIGDYLYIIFVFLLVVGAHITCLKIVEGRLKKKEIETMTRIFDTGAQYVKWFDDCRVVTLKEMEQNPLKKIINE